VNVKLLAAFQAIENRKGSMSSTATKVAQALLDIKAVGFTPDKPIRFKSGLLAPLYIDNRIFPSHPGEWKHVIEGFQHIIDSKQLKFEFIAGMESAGIPHSAALGFSMQRPSVFVRKAAKDHGTKKMVEGGKVEGKTVLLVEDLVTTGGSSLGGVRQIREAGGVVTDCLAIVSYDMPEATENFAKEEVTLHTLTNFPVILAEALKRNILNQEQNDTVHDWLRDPWGWEARQSK
jgi:orotate phosphoribosyltransferase